MNFGFQQYSIWGPLWANRALFTRFGQIALLNYVPYLLFLFLDTCSFCERILHPGNFLATNELAEASTTWNAKVQTSRTIHVLCVCAQTCEGMGWRSGTIGWAGLAELSEPWQVMVKWRIQAATGITDSMDQCRKDI